MRYERMRLICRLWIGCPIIIFLLNGCAVDKKAVVDPPAEPAKPPEMTISDAEGEWEGLMQSVIAFYQQGRYAEGVEHAQKAYGYAEDHFGKEDPKTLIAMNNLALLYDAQGRYGEAESLYKEALHLMEKMLGTDHPDTLITQMNYIAMKALTGEDAVAFRLLEQVEGRLLSQSFRELYTTRDDRVRRF